MKEFGNAGNRALLLAALVGAMVIAITVIGHTSNVSAARRQPTPTPPVLAPPPNGATWQQVDNHQKTCYFFPQSSTDTNYYGVWIQGTWSHAIMVSVSHLPAGGGFYTFDSPIPPGSSNGIGGVAEAAVVLPSSTPLGTYTASLTASDGTTTSTVPITLVVQANCGRY